MAPTLENERYKTGLFLPTGKYMEGLLRNIILGNRVYIDNYSEYRKIILSGQYAIVSLLVIMFYVTLEFIAQGPVLSQTNIVFGIEFVIIFSTLIFHRHNRHQWANYILFSSVNIVLFLVVSSESNDTYSFLFFLPIALGAFCIFNYEHRFIALTISISSFALAFLSIAGDFYFLEFRTYPDESIQINQIVNFGVSFPVSIMAVFMLINVNHDNSKLLTQSNKQLEKLNKELDRFVYSTSHDLRAPLLSVLGLLKLADRENTNDTVVKYHHMMDARLTTLDKFVSDITDYSRNNRLLIKKEKVNLHAMASDVWETLKYGAGSEMIDFKNELPVDLVVNTDQSRLRVVLSNLIANAIRYHDHRKHRKYIRIHHQLMNDSISIHIQDNGQGIAAEFQSKIFDMFFRANETSQGSGLGLYIVKETLSKLSGDIQLSSIPREGSTFTVNLKG